MYISADDKKEQSVPYPNIIKFPVKKLFMAIEQAIKDGKIERRIGNKRLIELHIQTKIKQLQTKIKQIPSSKAFKINEYITEQEQNRNE